MTIGRILLAALVFAAALGGALALREATYGAGPRPSSAAPAGPTREIAVVANAVGGTVSLVDVERGAVLRELNVIPDGQRVSVFRDPIQFLAQPIVEGRGGLNYAQDTDLSRDGTVLFVSRGFLADVVALDIATGAILWRTPVAGVRADHMTISPDGETLYVSAVIRGGDLVEAIRTRDGKKGGSFQAGRWPHDVHVSADGRSVWVASLGDMQLDLAARGAEPDAYTVKFFDAATYEPLATHVFDRGVRPFQMTADGRMLYAQLSNTHLVLARELETGAERRLELPVADGVTADDWDFEAPHHGLALSLDEQTLCIAGRASDYAGIVDAANLSLVETVPVGNAPSWAVFLEDGRRCVLANTRSDDVSIVDTDERRETARIAVGRGPKHVTAGRVSETVLNAN